MTFDDALFNWLQIRHVALERPSDHSAQETFQFFDQILLEDFQVTQIRIEKDEGMYTVYFTYQNEEQNKHFPVEFVHQLLIDIESEPKYNQ